MNPLRSIDVCAYAATGAAAGAGASYLASYKVAYGAVAGAVTLAAMIYVGSKKQFRRLPNSFKVPAIAAYPLILGAVTHTFQKESSLLKTTLVALTTLLGGAASGVFLQGLLPKSKGSTDSF